jgi:hydrogenase maturation protease
LDRILIIGYGNPDREDDGVAWHILTRLADQMGRSGPYDPHIGFEPDDNLPALWFMLQLTPEIAETIARYDRVCFVDAHTGAVPNEINVEKINSEFQNSPFTHHMTAATCMSFVETIYHLKPEAILVSVRGYKFGFEQSLSPQTTALAGEAAGRIWDWMNKRKNAISG